MMLALARHVRASHAALQCQVSPLRTTQRLVRRAQSDCRSVSTAPPAAPPHFFERVLEHQHSLALVETPSQPNAAALSATSATSSTSHVREWTYAELLSQALALRDDLASALGTRIGDRQPRIAFLGERGASYVIIQWAIWLAGAIAVPLHPRHPVDELEYILADSGAALVVASASFTASAHLRAFIETLPTSSANVHVPVHIHTLPTTSASEACCPSKDLSHSDVAAIRSWLATWEDHAPDAHIVYTSGTTGRPKGVVATHANVTAQIHDVVSSWAITRDDHLLHFLPLHHVHGILNNLLCVHYAGGSLEFLPSAQPALILSKLAASCAGASSAPSSAKPVTMLMAVPTVYMLMLEEIERLQDERARADAQDRSLPFALDDAVRAAQRLRVAISGSMACPVSILDRWQALTGQQLLERYGMTELGMVLTNPLRGERHFGYVGAPFPSVSVRLVDSDTDEAIDWRSEREGELRVKGPTVFREYWNKPDATATAFDADGWFKTGDIAQFSNAHASFRIRGRASADIIKSAGYKISALDVERVLLTHPQVQECAVFGLTDEKWGQVVASVIRASSTTAPRLVRPEQFDPPLPAFVKAHLADYAVPRAYVVVSEIPKNAMGKVNKKSLATLFDDSEAA